MKLMDLLSVEMSLMLPLAAAANLAVFIAEVLEE
tara:strand:- start:1363 stop:1464 length:102 start_codon:yes stop_codon:yes gene_type:complete